MGFFSYKAPMPDQVNGMKSTILYARPFRVQIAFVLGLITLMNLGIFVMSCIAVGTVSANYPNWNYSSEDKNFHARLFFFFVPIPLAIWLNSSVELYKRYRRTLQPLRIVITSSITFVFLGIAAGLWSPCIYPPWNSYWDDSPVSYCPFVSSDGGWSWIGSDEAPPASYYVLPWLLLPAAVLYLLYLGFGAMALHHVRKERKLNGPTENYQHEMYPDGRYKYWPTVYTEPFHVQDPPPSAYRPQFTSPQPTSPQPEFAPPVKVSSPPSYVKSTASGSHSYIPSRSTSYHSDTKDTRGPCTCNCPHH